MIQRRTITEKLNMIFGEKSMFELKYRKLL